MTKLNTALSANQVRAVFTAIGADRAAKYRAIALPVAASIAQQLLSRAQAGQHPYPGVILDGRHLDASARIELADIELSKQIEPGCSEAFYKELKSLLADAGFTVHRTLWTKDRDNNTVFSVVVSDPKF